MAVSPPQVPLQKGVSLTHPLAHHLRLARLTILNLSYFFQSHLYCTACFSSKIKIMDKINVLDLRLEIMFGISQLGYYSKYLLVARKVVGTNLTDIYIYILCNQLFCIFFFYACRSSIEWWEGCFIFSDKIGLNKQIRLLE